MPNESSGLRGRDRLAGSAGIDEDLNGVSKDKV